MRTWARPAEAPDALEEALGAAEAKAEAVGVSMGIMRRDGADAWLYVQDLRRGPEGRKGAGADALRDVCAAADAHGRRMDVHVMGANTPLEAYYRRLGFRSHRRDPENGDLEMRRQPGARTAQGPQRRRRGRTPGGGTGTG